MTSWGRAGRLALLLLLAGGLVLPAVGQGLTSSTEEAEGIRVVLDQHESGAIKTQLMAGSARVLDDGNIIEGQDVEIEIFDAEGERKQRILLEKCRLDHKRREADSDSRVELHADGLVITGIGMKWRGDSESLTILSDTKVQLVGALLDMKRLSQAGDDED